MTASRLRVAAVQTVSGDDVAENLRVSERLVAEAVGQGAQLVLLPEYFGIFGSRATAKVGARETDGDGPQQAALERMRSRIPPASEARPWSSHPTAGESRATTRSTCSPSARAKSATTKARRSSRAASRSPSTRRAGASLSQCATTCGFPSCTGASTTSR